jgi:hypothetical protein
MRAGAQAARLRSRGRRSDLVALAVMFSAGIHAALVPEHLQEMPPLGWSFIGAAALGAVLAWMLVARPGDRRVAMLAALFLAVEVLAWVLFVSVRVPGFAGTPEPVESIALVCKASELLGMGVAIGLAWPRLVWPQRATTRPHRSAVRRGSPAWGTPRSDPSAR